MALATDFRRVVLAAWESNLERQPEILAMILSLIIKKELFLCLFKRSGTPRYLALAGRRRQMEDGIDIGFDTRPSVAAEKDSRFC
ncbi:hypothetical protein SLA2020_318800 [Shorea laevis]